MTLVNQYWWLLVVFGCFGIGDFLGVYTKAKMSSVFVALMLFLVCFIAGVIPADIITQANMNGIAKFATAYIVFHIGTSINIQEMMREWKILVAALLAMGVAMIACFAMMPIVGWEAAVVSIPIINGGLVATQIMTDAAMDKGFPLAAALGTIVYAVQKFVGTIPASRAGLREAKIIVDDYRANKAKGIDLLKADAGDSKKSAEEKVPFWKKHEKYYTSYSILAIVGLFAYIASLIGGLTGISLTIYCLVLGMVVAQFGLAPPNILDKGKASGMMMVALFCSLIPSLSQITLEDLSQLGFHTFVLFGATLVAVYVLLYFLPTWKLVGSRNLMIGIAMSQLLGFPATFLITNEVATAVAETEDEKAYIVKKLNPAFVVSGFVSVTSVSIIIAGIFAGLL